MRRWKRYCRQRPLSGATLRPFRCRCCRRACGTRERLLGIHWAEPAHITRFMEVICGKDSDVVYAEKIVELAEAWGKEPSLLRKEHTQDSLPIALCTAMLREAFNLVENGYATVEDVDRSLRNDLGYWITFCRAVPVYGPDGYSGLPDGHARPFPGSGQPSDDAGNDVKTGCIRSQRRKQCPGFLSLYRTDRESMGEGIYRFQLRHPEAG